MHGRTDTEREARIAAGFAALGLRRAPDGWRIGPGAGEPVPEALAAELAAELGAAVSGPPDWAVPRAWARLRGRAAEPPRRLREAPLDGWESLAVARPYAGFFAVEAHRLSHRRFDGGVSPPLERAVFASGDAATVVPWDPVRDRVLLIEQFRAGPAARRARLPWCLEAVAGRCDGGESPEATVRREAVEEAGIALGRLARIAAYYPSPGLSAEFITAFVGEVELAGEGGVFGNADEHEDIRAFVLPRAEAMAAVAEGEVDNAPLLLSLLWLDANAARLKVDWGAA